MKIHFSTVEQFENCEMRYKFQYIDNIEIIDSDDPQNPLRIGTALHRAMEVDSETAIKEYLMSYPIITDKHIDEVIKLEYWIPKIKKIVPDGLHEVNFSNDWYEGTADLLVPCGNGQYDLYDYKYSNNVEHYMESRQLHVYKYFIKEILNIDIRNMYFVFVPKTNIRLKKTETLKDFRSRIIDELNKLDITIKEVKYQENKVIDFLKSTIKLERTEEFEKVQSYLCDWCEYRELCMEGVNYMILPKAERREVGTATKRKLWLYGGAFSGKTTFMDSAPMPINLNTDGNVQFVTMQYLPIKDTYEGRIKVLAWENFKNAIGELEKNDNNFKTIVVDLLEDTYESCRLYMYDKLGIDHESDDSFRAWDKVRTEFLSTIRRLMNLDYENIVLISHEDTSKDITKKTGDKITAIKPNIAEKVANKIAGMVDIVARVVVEDDGTRTLNFKSNEVVFGGGRLKNITHTSIPLDWSELCKVYDEANENVHKVDKTEETEKVEEPKRGRRKKEETEEEQHVQTEFEEIINKEIMNDIPEEVEEVKEEKPKRTRRTRRERNVG